MHHMIPAKSCRLGGEKKKIHKLDCWLVSNSQSQGTIHISHVSTLQVTRGERLLPIFRGLDASGFYIRHFRNMHQLGWHHLQAVEHLHKTSLGAKGGRYPRLQHRLVSTGHHMRQERFH
jgi:hypothetical protein